MIFFCTPGVFGSLDQLWSIVTISIVWGSCCLFTNG